MLLERIVSAGLAHNSYLVGDKALAVVIDPRRDVDVYIDLAHRAGLRIGHILETHRNEDYFVGSMELAERTGAEVWHADAEMDYKYGRPVSDGQRWKAGRLEIEAIATPGHTPGSMSYLLCDPSGVPWILFSGDALFSGDVGRVDLLGEDRVAENAGLLYDSLWQRVLPLGDEVMLCPAHGSGSVCGEAIAERTWSTLGIERKHNPRLAAASKEQFVSELVASQPPDRPPYFRYMEKVNLEGRPILGAVPSPRPLDPASFSSLARTAQVVDTRQELGFSAAHVPGSLSIWMGGLASFAGWFLRYDRPILLVGDGDYVSEATAILLRLGLDDIAGFLGGGMLSWHMAGFESSAVQTITVQAFCRLLDLGEEKAILDVRSEGELKRVGRIEGSQHIHITSLPERMSEIPVDRSLYIFCGSGMRSMLAASFLKAHGWKDLIVILGGASAWRSRVCPIQKIKANGSESKSKNSGT